MTALAIMFGFAAGLIVGVLWMLDGQDRAIQHEAAELDREHPPLTDAEWDQIREVARPDDRCPECKGRDGAHGLIHVRHEQGGGGTNRPCSRSLDHLIKPGVWPATPDEVAMVPLYSLPLRSVPAQREGDSA